MACHGILSCPIQDCVSNREGGQEISLSPWGLLGIAGSLEQLPAAAGDREPRNACASLAFLGPTVLPLKSLGSTRPHTGPHCWYILSHYERNLERDDSSFGQCRTGSWLSCQLLHFLFCAPHIWPPTPNHAAQSQAGFSKV